MKSRRIQILEKILRGMAISVLNRRNPIVVGITGSVGKTSAKEAVSLVLSSSLRVRKNEKNYNNEIGIPLTIIGAKSGGRNLIKWLLVFLKWLWVMSFSLRYPNVLVLELGIDRPGDMKYFMSFIKPSMAVVTNISVSHIEFFGSISKIAKEKGILVENVSENGFVFLNSDDKNSLGMKERTKAKIVTYGFSEGSDFRASRNVYSYDDNNNLKGVSFKLEFEGKSIPVRLPRMLAFHQLYFALIAIAVGNTFKINPIDAINSLKEFAPPQGRMNLIGGIKNSKIIDDTYNASPISSVAAIEVLGKLISKRRIAVMGDMLELGEETENGHREVGRKIFLENVDILIAVGERMKIALLELEKMGYSKERILHFDDPVSASEKICEIVEAGDLILVKGSQGMRMEKIVERIMEDPKKAPKLLTRQSKDWKNIKFKKP